MSNNKQRFKFKDWRHVADVLMTHAAIVISGMLIVFFLIDRVNKPMGFMVNEFHKCITFALCLLAIYLAGHRIAAHRKSLRDAADREETEKL